MEWWCVCLCLCVCVCVVVCFFLWCGRAGFSIGGARYGSGAPVSEGTPATVWDHREVFDSQVPHSAGVRAPVQCAHAFAPAGGHARQFCRPGLRSCPVPVLLFSLNPNSLVNSLAAACVCLWWTICPRALWYFCSRLEFGVGICVGVEIDLLRGRS